MAVLESHAVTKNFLEGREVVSVLKGVSLAVERGEVVGLEGPSGSGKTTLLFILGGLLTPSSGRVIIEGEEVDPGRTDQLPELRKRSIGFVFQQFNLFPALTALENVEYALNIKGIRGLAAHREAATAARGGSHGGSTPVAPTPSLGRPKAARGDCAGPRRPGGDHPGRRADRQHRFPTGKPDT